MSRTKKYILRFVIFILVVGIGYGGYLGYSVYKFTAKISAPGVTSDPQDSNVKLPPPPAPKENMNILVVGVDSGKWINGYRTDTGRTDTIMLFSLNPSTKKISLVSVPRDTYVNIPTRGMDKVNHAYAFGGIDLSIKTLSQFLGIPIHHYIKVDYVAFVKLVDDLGGVTVNVTENVVSKTDNKVKIPKGTQTMDGKTAFTYVNVREGDIGRVERQQHFVKSLASQALTLGNIPKFPGILNDISSDIKTDMSPKQIMDFALQVRSMDPGNMKNEIIPGKAEMIKGISYWVPDQAGSESVVNRLLR